MVDVDDIILQNLKESGMTVREIVEKVGHIGSEMLIDKRVRMLRKWGLVEYTIQDRGLTGRKPYVYSLSDRAKTLLEKRVKK